MFENILLEKDQEELLIELVEIVRSIPKDERRKFIIIRSHDGDKLFCPGFQDKNKKIYFGDIETLDSEGL